MHPKLKTGRVAIYARFSSDSQREASIDDQVRRCREYIARGGGDPVAATVYSDHAISGSSLDRPSFERLMTAVERGTIDLIVTEDLSRISRETADSATVFKKLQFYAVPLLSVGDGIDTSAKGAKLSYTVKSLVADLYIEDLRDKTLRGLEGRALAGFATGNVPYGYKTVPELDKYGRAIGSRIEIHEGEAQIIRRIFNEYLLGHSLATIANGLNKEDIPSPRQGTRHTRWGWGPGTIRAMLYNERYAGIWRFKERQWVKVPGTNRRLPRARDASEVITNERPELRLIEADVWHRVTKRLSAIRNKYTKKDPTRMKTNYLFSGVLVCEVCERPLTIVGGSSSRYYRCSTSRHDTKCPNARHIKEGVVRTRILDAIHERLASPEGKKHVREAIAKILANQTNDLDTRIKECRARITKTSAQIADMVDFVKRGERSETVGASLRELESYLRAEKAALSKLLDAEAKPAKLPSVEDVARLAYDLDKRLSQDIEAGRAQLVRWLRTGSLRVSQTKDGTLVAEGALNLRAVLADSEKTKPAEQLAGSNSGWYPGEVAGAGACRSPRLCRISWSLAWVAPRRSLFARSL